MLRSLTLKTLAVNSGLLALGLVNSVLLSRWLGPAERGEVAAALLWPMLLVFLGSLGLIPSTLYFAAQPGSKSETVLANALALAVLQSLVLMPLGFAATPWLLASQSLAVVSASKFFLLVIPISLATQYGLSVLQGNMHISLFNGLRAIIPVGYLAGVIIFRTHGQLTVLNIVVLQLSLNLIVLLGTLLALVAVGVRLRIRTDRSVAKRMLSYGVKVQVGEISQGMNLRLDQALMAAWLPPTQLGLYVAAVSAAGLPQVLSNAFRMVVTPSIAQRASPEERIAILQSVFRLYWLLSVGATVAIAVILPSAIPIVFGAEFQSAVWPAEVLLLGTLLVGAKDVLTGGAQALGNPWLVSRAELTALAVTLVLLLTLLPIMGIMGAAIASLLAYATVLTMVVHGLYRFYAISPLGLFQVRRRDLTTLLANR